MASPELTAPAPGAPAVLRPGGLLWAFHDGFAGYVARLADGRIDIDGGAQLQADGRVFFPFASASASILASDLGSDLGSGQDDDIAHGLDGGSGPGGFAGTDELLSTGALHFTGHHGLLAVTLADPAVVTTAGSAVLTVADPFVPGQRMVFAALGPAESDTVTPGAEPGAAAPNSITSRVPSPIARYAEPLLTEDGADLFFGHYREGTPLAPLAVIAAEPGHATVAVGAPSHRFPAPPSFPAPAPADQDA